MLKNIELLIFDLDGTLVDSQYDLGDAVNHTLTHLNRAPLASEKIPKMLGSGITKLLESALGTYADHELEYAQKIFMDYYAKNYTKKTNYFPEVPKVLQQLPRFKKVVFSNKYHPFTVTILQNLHLDHYFDEIQGIIPEKIKSKPDPEGIHLLLTKFGVSPDRALMIGDSTHDIEAGKRAGTYTCAVTYGYRPLSVLQNSEPDYLINTLSDLKNIIV